MSLDQSYEVNSSVRGIVYIRGFSCVEAYVHILHTLCKWQFMRACTSVSVQVSICTQAYGQAGLLAGNYCTVVKHHYSLICPLAPSVLLSATLYTISIIPRTTPPEHTHHPSPRAQAYRRPLITSSFSPSMFYQCPFCSQYAVSGLLCCSLRIWIQDWTNKFKCITLIYQEV